MAISIGISIVQNSQSIADNTSNVTVKVNASWTYGSYNKIEKSGYLTIDGTKYNFTSTFNTGQSTTGSQTLFTKTVNVSHNSDGTKTLQCNASYTSGVSSGTVTASASKVLTTIPRKSSISASNGTLGTAQTLTVTKQSSGFTHTITYSCGSASGTIATKSSNTSISWTPPLSLASQNTVGTSVSIKFTITTFNGNTSVGTNTKTITCAIPASVKPSCTISVTDPTGHATTYGNPVKGLSKYKIVVTPTTAYGSAIASYTVTVNGTKYTSASFTTGIITASGTQTITATIKDKRGRTATATASRTVLDYTIPTVNVLTVKRCNSDGSENDQGEFVQATFSAAVSALNNKNTAAYTLKYKKSTATTYTETALSALANKYSVTNSAHIFPAESGSSYNVVIVVQDKHNTTTRMTTASTAFTLMHHGTDGRSLAIGKLCELPDLFDVGLPSRFNQPVYGKVAGLDKLPAIPADSDLNNYMETGCFSVQSNAIAETIANIPVKRAGRLEIISSTGEGIRLTQWSYLRQRFTPYNADNAVWERDITRSADNVWRYYDWYRTTLSKTASEMLYHGQKVLWGGDMASGMFMTSGHTATLSEKVSEQPNGIILVFCYYNGTGDTNWGFQSFYIPKQLVALETGEGHTFHLTNGKFGSVGTKYLYINDGTIVGHADNNLTGTGSGITYANNKFVLRYVLGV